MGCTSSTEVVRDPVTGQAKQKKKLGGAYPGNRRVAKPVYKPGDDEYKQIDSNTAVANAHFVTCPGGNALMLVGKPNRVEDDGGGGGGLAKTYISVTLPPNVHPGDIIHVRAPDGRMNAITVPPGMGPGSTFTVEFSDDPQQSPPEEESDLTPGLFVPTVVAQPDVEYAGTAGVEYAAGNYSNNDDVGGGGNYVVANATTGPYVPAYDVPPETNKLG